VSGNGGWRVTVGFEAQKDLWTFGWEPGREVGGCVLGRFECSGISRRDTGKDLFVRRIFRSDFGGDETSVDIDFASVFNRQTIETTSSRTSGGGGGGRWGADDPGVLCGFIHSHPGIERERELSDTDIRTASLNALNNPPALAGKPFLSAIATAGEAWREGEPHEDWSNPVLDFHLVFSDRRVVKPLVSLMSEVEWLCEEQQRALAAAVIGDGHEEAARRVPPRARGLPPRKWRSRAGAAGGEQSPLSERFLGGRNPGEASPGKGVVRRAGARASRPAPACRRSQELPASRQPGRGRKHLACESRSSRVRAIRVRAGDRGLTGFACAILARLHAEPR
jgi:hypothetical protein